MPRPDDIVKYFAELAPVGRGPRWNHAPAAGDMVSIPWPWDVAEDEGGSLIIRGKTSDMWRLWSAARIHGSRDFLRLGWMFLSGDVAIGNKTTKVFLPVASAPVRLRRAAQHGSRSNQIYEVVADADMTVPESVFPDHRVRQELNEELETLVNQAFAGTTGVVTWEFVKPFIARFCAEAGLTTPEQVRPAAEPVAPTGGDLSIHTGLAVYTAHDRTAINLESTLREWSQQSLSATALDKVYSSSAAREPDFDHAVANSLPLNRTQERAVLAARELPVAVISGPPGTGKTHTAVAIAIDLVAHDHSVLIAAQSDDAVDAIEAMLNRFASPRHVRFGSRSSRKKVAVELSDGLVSDPATSLRSTVQQLEAMEDNLDEIEAGVVRRLEIEAAFSRSLEVRRRLSWVMADAPGLSSIVGDDPACHAVLRLLERRNGAGLLGPVRRWLATRKVARMLGIPADQVDRLEQPVGELVVAERAIRAGQQVAPQSISDEFARLDEVAADMRKLFGHHVEAQRSGRSWDPGATREIGLLATALRSGQAARRRALRTIEMDAALDALPLWIGTLADIDDVLPIRPGMFDIVIIDEASQVNQVRAATSLARANRAVVVGDPRQLRHVSFLGDAAMEAAAAQLGIDRTPLLDVRRNSLFDVAAGSTPVMQLSEHYRSSRHLIEFSNRRFYDGRLELMTEHPASSSEDAIHVERVAGSRNPEGVVEAELERAFQLIAVAQRSGSNSVGVVTPFRAQADAMASAARKRFRPDEIEAIDLRIATVHGFQGNERDNVIVSLGVGPDDIRSLRFIEDPNLFNVMVTRARVDLTMLISLDPDALPEGILADYIRHAARPPVGPGRQASQNLTGWKAAVVGALEPYGLPIWVDYPVGTHRIDIAAGEGDDAVGVECSIHEAGVEAHIDRHMALRRAGWDLMTALESRWLSRPEDAADAIAHRVVQRSRRAAAETRAPRLSDSQIRPNESAGQ